MSTQTERRIVVINPGEVDEQANFQCTKCKEMKPISEYHARGASHQRICKACRKAHVPSGEKRIIFINRPENYEALFMRINALDKKLHSISYSMANNNLDADDLYGAMVDEILFKSKIDDSDSRILTRAKWAAKAVLRRNSAYNMHVADESEMTIMDEDGELDVDIRIAFTKSAEQEYEEMECNAHLLEVIGQLEPKYQKIISMISMGNTQREISFKMKINEKLISVLIKKIAAELESLGINNN